MIEISFTKAHGAENDFLLTWGDEIWGKETSAGQMPPANLAEIGRRICARTAGIGADGWMLLWPEQNGLRTRLFNADGSEAEISGNGTRCAAAFTLSKGIGTGPDIPISTAAGTKKLHLITRSGNRFMFEMDMGLPKTEEIHARVQAADREFDATILNVGNPQCAVFSDELPEAGPAALSQGGQAGFPSDWRAAAREIESHPRFPQRTNVSFVRVLDRHSIEAVFFERGAGETRSSGTGSTGAAVAAILRDVAESPVQIRTPGAVMTLRWDDSVYLTGPAEIVGEGRFFLDL